MTEIERKKRGEKSAVIMERMVRGKLRAMGCERFDLGILPDAGDMMLREKQRSICAFSNSVRKKESALSCHAGWAAGPCQTPFKLVTI